MRGKSKLRRPSVDGAAVRLPHLSGAVTRGDLPTTRWEGQIEEGEEPEGKSAFGKGKWSPGTEMISEL